MAKEVKSKERTKQKDFSELFSETWLEYWKKFKLIFVITLILYLIPSVLFYVANKQFVSAMVDIKGLQGIEVLQILIKNSQYLAIFLSSVFIFMVLSLVMSLILIYVSLSKEKISFGKAFSSSMKYFWKFFGLHIVLFFALFGLFLLLIIPGIIFLIFWLFSPFILINENTRIIEAMKKSKQIVKGKWWRVFGYFLLIMLIIILISIAILILFGILNLIFKNISVVSFVPNLISNYINTLVFVFFIFFLKNFYLSLKK